MNNAAEQEARASPNGRTFRPLAVVLVANDAPSHSAQNATQDRVVIEQLAFGNQGRQRQQSRSDCKPYVHLFL